MGLFTSKIAGAVILSGSVTLGGLGLLYTGTDVLDGAKDSVKDFGNRLVQFEQNEGSLLEKIKNLKADANGKIGTANASIADLQSQKEVLLAQKGELTETVKDLNAQIVTLDAEILDLKNKLATETANHQATKDQLAIKTAEYNAKVKELATANNTIKNLNATLKYAEEKAGQADKLVAELEGEIKKANEDVAEHGKDVEAVKVETENAQPLSNEEVDSVDTTIEEVVTPK